MMHEKSGDNPVSAKYSEIIKLFEMNTIIGTLKGAQKEMIEMLKRSFNLMQDVLIQDLLNITGAEHYYNEEMNR
jgi:hypothetical protein